MYATETNHHDSLTAVIVDDHPMCRQATAIALRAVRPEARVIEATTFAEALAAAPEATLMTLDLALPDNRSVHGMRGLSHAFPQLKLLVISGAAHPGTEAQVAAGGAHGYLSKAASMEEMITAIRTVLGGGTWFGPAAHTAAADDDDFGRLAALTPAQMRVLTAMEGGRLNKQIAFDLNLSEITVKAHVKAILKKLAVVNRTQAVLVLQRAHA